MIARVGGAEASMPVASAGHDKSSRTLSAALFGHWLTDKW